MNIVLLGDSNTWIGGDECDKPQGWNKWFKDLANPLSCHSYARSGATWTHTSLTDYDTEEDTGVLSDNNVVYNQINRLKEAYQQQKQVKPDLIIVMAGTNDLWFADKRPEVRKGYSKDGVHTTSKGARVLGKYIYEQVEQILRK